MLSTKTFTTESQIYTRNIIDFKLCAEFNFSNEVKFEILEGLWEK